jgi:ketosteroid isomerase-like protein
MGGSIAWSVFVEDARMSGEKVELVHRVTDLFNERDLEAALEFLTDDFVMDWSNSIGPLRGIYDGREGLRRLWETFTEAWESIRWEPLEVSELDDDHLLVINSVHMRGKGSGVDVEASGAQLWTFRDGIPASIKLYQSKAEALAAVGP